MHARFHRRTATAAGFLCFFLWTATLGAETILVAVEETLDDAPCPLPLPAKEGVSSAFFDGGHIVFDTADSSPIPSMEELRTIALSGGADWILVMRVEYAEVPQDASLARVTAKVRYSFSNAWTAEAKGGGDLSASNEGRESTVDRTALGLEIGKRIAREVESLINKDGKESH